MVKFQTGPRENTQFFCDTEGQKPGDAEPSIQQSRAFYYAKFLLNNMNNLVFVGKKVVLKMGKDWLKVLIAAFFEIMWVVGLKYADSMIEWSLTVIGMIGSFYLLILAGRNLPIGTVYAVFVGIGTAGTVLLDFIIFGEPFSLAKVLLIGLMLVGIIGLKLVEDAEGKAVE